MITQSQKQKLMMLRGFGYQEKEIADRLDISRKTVSNYLVRLKVESEIMFESGKTLDQVYYKQLLGIEIPSP